MSLGKKTGSIDTGHGVIKVKAFLRDVEMTWLLSGGKPSAITSAFISRELDLITVELSHHHRKRISGALWAASALHFKDDFHHEIEGKRVS